MSSQTHTCNLDSVDSSSLEKLANKMDTEDYAIIYSYKTNRTEKEVKSINRKIRKYLVENKTHCYNLIFENIDSNSKDYTILLFRNAVIFNRSEFNELCLGVSSYFSENAFIMGTRASGVKLYDIKGNQIGNFNGTNDIIKSVEDAYSCLSSQNEQFKILGVAEPVNNLGKMAFAKCNISWLK